MVYPLVQYRGPAYPDLSQPTSPASSRELDSRVSDGIHVRLPWHSGDGHVLVAVHDTKTGDVFELPVRDTTRVLDVYHHPYAYAGERPSVAGSVQAAEPNTSGRRPVFSVGIQRTSKYRAAARNCVSIVQSAFLKTVGTG